MNTSTQHFPRTNASIEAGVVSTLPAVRPAQAKPLTDEESCYLAQYEGEIQSGFDQVGYGWRKVIRNINRVRDEDLYRVEYRSIREYCRKKWGKSYERILQWIRSEKVLQNIENGASESGVNHGSLSVGDTTTEAAAPKSVPDVLPNERQARELGKLKVPEEQREGWGEAQGLAAAQGKPVSLKHVRAVVERRSKPALSTMPVDKTHEGAVLTFVETRAFDSLAKLGDASRVLKALDIELTQELYHAGQAADHLGCLVKLLQNRIALEPLPAGPCWKPERPSNNKPARRLMLSAAEKAHMTAVAKARWAKAKALGKKR